jgi:hypothetical protein
MFPGDLISLKQLWNVLVPISPGFYNLSAGVSYLFQFTFEFE